MVAVYVISIVLYFYYFAIATRKYLHNRFKNAEEYDSVKLEKSDVFIGIIFIWLGVVPGVNTLLLIVFIIDYYLESINEYFKHKYFNNKEV